MPNEISTVIFLTLVILELIRSWMLVLK